jgi:5'-nucleotidase
MRVLLTNDDGIHAPGLWALHQAFATRHQVTVVAPDRERSAVGHGITLHQPIRFENTRVNGSLSGFAVNGTPADCVKLGLAELLDAPPELVVSGINPGANVGINVNYSGTVAAAKEAALYGMPAIAVSIRRDAPNYYDEAAYFIEQLAAKVVEHGLPFGTFLNVNIPNMPLKQIAGIRISKLGIAIFPEYVEKRVDPRNRPYYWQGCDSLAADDNPEIDGTALCENFISITPISCDMTDYKSFEALKSWGIDGLGQL